MIERFILPKIIRPLSLLTITIVLSCSAPGQSLTAGTVSGTVTDPNNAVVPNATVTIENSVTTYKQTATTGEDGVYRFDNVPLNNYVFSASAAGFTGAHGPISIRSSVPINFNIQLTIAGATETVTITGADLIENVSSAHVDVGRDQMNRLPNRSPGNGLSDVVTLKAPGVVADSNGFFHPLGDHAEATMVLDGQPISDQQSKAFSTQIPVNAIESLEVTTGAAPAWAGDKTSLVIDATTRSGLNEKKPTGSFNVLYGTFGSTHEDGALAYGNARGGNFVAFNFDRSGRFLDAPELTVLHDRGIAANIFDRIDYSPNTKDTFHLNLFFASQ